MKILGIAILAALILTSNIASASSKISNAVNTFGWKYFATLNRNENIFYSPYSLAAALSIIANGSNGITRAEILDALNADSIDALNDGFADFRGSIAENYSDQNSLRDANLILVNSNFIGNGINPAFEDIAENVYGSKIRAADFEDDLDGEKIKISNWVSDATNGFIPNYQAAPTADTIVDLLNVIYFKGFWEFNFPVTRGNIFTSNDGTKLRVEMMRRNFNDEIRYYADDTYKAIALPYKNRRAAMYLILPNDNSNLNIANDWNAEDISYKENFFAQVDNAEIFGGNVEVMLPKFELDIKNNLVEDLKSIGIERAFTNSAEFDNIVNNVQLKIDNATHQAKIKVNEQGTEAVAVTEIMVAPTSSGASRVPTVRFHARRPFVFVIRDVQSGVNLFAGAVNKFD